MGSRQRPLQTCWISLVEITNKAYTTTSRNFNGGDLAVQFASLSAICTLQCQILAFLAFLDDRLLRMESLAETIFPPFKQLFDRVDEHVKAAEALPEKLDDSIEKLPALVRQVPFLDWALVHSISWLGFLITVMTYWGVLGVKEKEINVADVNNRYSGGSRGKTKKKKKKTGNVDVQIFKEGPISDDQLLTKQEIVTSEKLVNEDSEMVGGKSEIVPPHVDVQLVMIDGLMVQQEPDCLTILASDDEAMIVQDNDEKNDVSRGADEKYGDIDPKVVEETKEDDAPISNDEAMKIVARDIYNQTFEADGPRIIGEAGHQTFLTSDDETVVKDSDETNDNIRRIDHELTSNDPKVAEGTEEQMLTSHEKSETVAEGTDDQTFASNEPTNENESDHQTLQASTYATVVQESNNENYNVAQDTNQNLATDDTKTVSEGTGDQTFASNEPTNENESDHPTLLTNTYATVVQESNNENYNVAQDTNQNLATDDPKTVSEGTEEQHGLASNEEQGNATQENDHHPTTFTSNDLKIEPEPDTQTFLTNSEPTHRRENSDQTLPWNESEIDPSVTTGSAFVSETDETAMDSDCSQMKSYSSDICAPSPNERAEASSMARISRTTSWSNVVRGSYKDVLEKGKIESLLEIPIPRPKGSSKQDKWRRQAKKAARGGGAQDESREGKGRRKVRRKKVENKVESFSDYGAGK